MEIERKFLVKYKDVADIIKTAKETQYISQIYLSRGTSEGPEVRMRKAKVMVTNSGPAYVDCSMAVKSSGTLYREEMEIPMLQSRFDRIVVKKLYVGNVIKKARYKVPLTEDSSDGLIAEVDLYGNKLVGLCTVEVEFASEEQARNFVPPTWFGKEVTGITAYKNSHLAILEHN